MHIIKQSKQHLACRVDMAACIERQSNQNGHACSWAARCIRTSTNRVTRYLWHRLLALLDAKIEDAERHKQQQPTDVHNSAQQLITSALLAHSRQNLCLHVHLVQHFSILGGISCLRQEPHAVDRRDSSTGKAPPAA